MAVVFGRSYCRYEMNEEVHYVRKSWLARYLFLKNFRYFNFSIFTHVFFLEDAFRRYFPFQMQFLIWRPYVPSGDLVVKGNKICACMLLCAVFGHVCVCVWACVPVPEGWGTPIEFMISFARDGLCSLGIVRASLTRDCLIPQVCGF